MITRDKLHDRIAAVLKDQDYGHRGAQPSRNGMAWALTNEVITDLLELDSLRAKIAILVRNAQNSDDLDVYAELCQLVDRDPAIRAHLERLTGPGGGA